MKKLFCILISGHLLFATLSANIEYRLANNDDADQILNLYNKFTEDDKSKLLVFPLHIQKEVIFENIQKKHFFVAFENETGNIISFLKLHIANPDEVNSILTEELCLGLESYLIKDCCYYFSTEILNSFKLPLRQIHMTRSVTKDLLSPIEKKLIRSNRLDSCLYLYHGSAYTLPLYRGRGISTQLLRYAFDSIKECFLNKKFLALLYGQVDDNVCNVAMIRMFAKCIANIFPHQTINGIKFQHLCCRAYKPTFNEKGKLEVIRDKKHSGLGSMVVYSVKAN